MSEAQIETAYAAMLALRAELAQRGFLYQTLHAFAERSQGQTDGTATRLIEALAKEEQVIRKPADTSDKEKK